MTIDSSSDYSSSEEEEICQEMERMTLDQMTEPESWDSYGAVYDNTVAYDSNTTEAERSVCEIIQISGELHIEHLPCYNHREEEEEEGGNDGRTDDDDDDSDIQEASDPKVEEDTKLEEVKPDFDDDATEFETEQDWAEQVDPGEVYDEAYESRDQKAAEVEGPEVKYKLSEDMKALRTTVRKKPKPMKSTVRMKIKSKMKSTTKMRTLRKKSMNMMKMKSTMKMTMTMAIMIVIFMMIIHAMIMITMMMTRNRRKNMKKEEK